MDLYIFTYKQKNSFNTFPSYKHKFYILDLD